LVRTDRVDLSPCFARPRLMTAAMASLSALVNPASVDALFDMPVTLPSTSLTSFVGISLDVTTNTLSSMAVICSSDLAVFIRAHFLIRNQKKNNIPTITSLIETAKANDLEPYQYLRHLFENIPQAKTAEDLKALLPMNLDQETINKLKP